MDELLDDQFQELVANSLALYAKYIDEDVRAWERQDAPDYPAYPPADFPEDLADWRDVTDQFTEE